MGRAAGPQPPGPLSSWPATRGVGRWRWTAGAHLPDARLLAVHHSHVAGLAAFDELPLRLIQLLRHEAHEGVVRGVSCSQAVGSGRGYRAAKDAARVSLDRPLGGVPVGRERPVRRGGEHAGHPPQAPPFPRDWHKPPWTQRKPARPCRPLCSQMRLRPRQALPGPCPPPAQSARPTATAPTFPITPRHPPAEPVTQVGGPALPPDLGAIVSVPGQGDCCPPPFPAVPSAFLLGNPFKLRAHQVPPLHKTLHGPHKPGSLDQLQAQPHAPSGQAHSLPLHGLCSRGPAGRSLRVPSLCPHTLIFCHSAH